MHHAAFLVGTPPTGMAGSEQPFPFSVVESLSNTGAKTVYGEPVTVGSRTIIPVAQAAYGFGGGEDGDGGGGGGGVLTTPVGALELTDETTRFVPIHPLRRLVAAGAVGLLVGYLLGRRR